jgi:hypothetical protein
MILPALNPTTATNEPFLAFNNAPAIGVPVSPLYQRRVTGIYERAHTALLMPIIVPTSLRSLQILAVEDACKLIMAPWKKPYKGAKM